MPDDPLPPHIPALEQASAYPVATNAVALVQTHISYVFLLDRDVYKLKKPVDLGFVNFTTLESRRHDCEEEVRLNQRGCPGGVYYGVAAVVRDGDGFRVSSDDEEAAGDVVDYAVHMRRLPQDGMMDVLLEEGEVGLEMIGKVAGRLADLHRGAAASAEITAKGGTENHRRNWHENMTQAEPFVGRTVGRKRFERIEAYVAAVFAREALLLRRREHDGWIRECHGDLRSDAVCFDESLPGGICIYDCIEFNEAFRYSDTGLDAAFLAMDLDYRGRPDLSDLFIGLYAAAIGDRELPLMLNFYKCFRAVVRGKVESLLLDDAAVSPEQKKAARGRARAYFKLAEEYTKRPAGQRLVLVTGPSGSGKSVHAGSLAARFGAVMLSTDVVRRELFERQEEREAIDSGRYEEAARQRVYDEIEAQARDALADGRSVVIDGTYVETSQRAPIVALSRELGVRLLVIECYAPDEVVRERQTQREGEAWTTSEGRWEVYVAQRERMEPADEVPPNQRLALNTTETLQEQLTKATTALHLRARRAAETQQK